MLRAIIVQLAGAFIILGVACAVLVLIVPKADAAECHGQIVRASWYGSESGNRTASGLPFDGSQLLVAHRTLPLKTRVRITYAGRSMVVRVEDRGPAKWTGKDLDLSQALARALHFKDGKVCVEVLK